jgi:small subunit ribosomal protein S1
VKSFVNYGAFIEIEGGIEGLVHIRDLSWTRRLSHPSEMLNKGDDLEWMVLSISKEKKKLSLGLKQLLENPWETTIPTKYAEGTEVKGKVSKVVSFGVFVELEKDLEGLIHSSRMGKGKENIALATGDVVHCKVEKLDLKEGKIGLGLTEVLEKAPPPPEGAAPVPAPAPAPEPETKDPT